MATKYGFYVEVKSEISCHNYRSSIYLNPCTALKILETELSVIACRYQAHGVSWFYEGGAWSLIHLKTKDFKGTVASIICVEIIE